MAESGRDRDLLAMAATAAPPPAATAAAAAATPALAASPASFRLFGAWGGLWSRGRASGGGNRGAATPTAAPSPATPAVPAAMTPSATLTPAMMPTAAGVGSASKAPMVASATPERSSWGWGFDRGAVATSNAGPQQTPVALTQQQHQPQLRNPSSGPATTAPQRLHQQPALAVVNRRQPVSAPLEGHPADVEPGWASGAVGGGPNAVFKPADAQHGPRQQQQQQQPAQHAMEPALLHPPASWEDDTVSTAAGGGRSVQPNRRPGLGAAHGAGVEQHAHTRMGMVEDPHAAHAAACMQPAAPQPLHGGVLVASAPPVSAPAPQRMPHAGLQSGTGGTAGGSSWDHSGRPQPHPAQHRTSASATPPSSPTWSFAGPKQQGVAGCAHASASPPPQLAGDHSAGSSPQVVQQAGADTVGAAAPLLTCIPEFEDQYAVATNDDAFASPKAVLKTVGSPFAASGEQLVDPEHTPDEPTGGGGDDEVDEEGEGQELQQAATEDTEVLDASTEDEQAVTDQACSTGAADTQPLVSTEEHEQWHEPVDFSDTAAGGEAGCVSATEEEGKVMSGMSTMPEQRATETVTATVHAPLPSPAAMAAFSGPNGPSAGAAAQPPAPLVVPPPPADPADPAGQPSPGLVCSGPPGVRVPTTPSKRAREMMEEEVLRGWRDPQAAARRTKMLGILRGGGGVGAAMAAWRGDEGGGGGGAVEGSGKQQKQPYKLRPGFALACAYLGVELPPGMAAGAVSGEVGVAAAAAAGAGD